MRMIISNDSLGGIQMKVYAVELCYHDEMTELEVDGPFIEKLIVKIFPTKEKAENWIEGNFIHYVKNDSTFCDFKIAEKEVEDEKVVKDATLGEGYCINATVDANLEKVRIHGFSKYTDLFTSYAYCDFMNKSFQISCRLPGNLKTRSEVIDFLKAKAREINK